MLFQSPEFGLLFAATLAAFYLVARGHRLKVLAVASLAFYAASGVLDFFLLLGTLAVSYIALRQVRPGGPKWPVVVPVFLLLAGLGYFKYSDFAYDNVQGIFGLAEPQEQPGWIRDILPLGISFYTFQIVALFIDVQKGRTRNVSSFLEYLVFVLFFPQLIAGPIMRGAGYLAQLAKLDGGRAEDFRAGGLLILTGLVKKVLIADFLAERVDARFAATSFTQPDAWVAAALFAFQIYFDFSGYVDMALGLGRMVGVKLDQNFFTPYLSRNASEFWRRWHITLSNWFRDYLYIPLGGNRKGLPRELFNLLLVMTVAGLWHGAGWTFVLWGFAHGVLLAAGRFWPTAMVRGALPLPKQWKQPAYAALSVLVFFNLTVLAWVPFRAADLSTTWEMLRAVLTFSGSREWVAAAPMVAVIAGLFALHVAERYVRENVATASRAWGYLPASARGAAYAGALVLVVAFSQAQQSFIYFRF